MEIPLILKKLSENPIENAWAIQDLTVWPGRTKIFFTETPTGLSYLLISGHPSQDRHPMIILNDSGGNVETLFKHLPAVPFVIRESRASILSKVRPLYPDAYIYLEQRMDLKKTSAKLVASTKARRLVEEDSLKLGQLQGAPPQVAPQMKMWIQGAVIMAIFEDEKIVSMGTTIVRTQDVWDLAAIKTHPDYRQRGYASEVVSALAAEAFKNKVNTVSLTVLKNNAVAIKTYSNLGFQPQEDRVWIDIGTGAKP